MNLRNSAEQILRSKYDTHKLRCSRPEGDKYPGENKPNLDNIKKELFDLYKAKDDTTSLTLETWNEHFYCSFVRARGKDRKI